MEKQAYKVGDHHQSVFKIEADTINKFAEVTGDKNPIHLDENYAEKTLFKRRIAHGFLYGSFISKVLGTEFPGEGTVYLSQSMTFLLPVYISDLLTIDILVIESLPKNRLRLQTNIWNQNNELVLKVEALVMKINF